MYLQQHIAEHVTNVKLDPDIDFIEEFTGFSKVPVQDACRYMVNRIRHNHSNYCPREAKGPYSGTYREILYKRHKNCCLHKIAEAYPILEKECNNQKYDLDMVTIVR